MQEICDRDLNGQSVLKGHRDGYSDESWVSVLMYCCAERGERLLLSGSLKSTWASTTQSFASFSNKTGGNASHFYGLSGVAVLQSAVHLPSSAGLTNAREAMKVC